MTGGMAGTSQMAPWHAQGDGARTAQAVRVMLSNPTQPRNARVASMNGMAT